MENLFGDLPDYPPMDSEDSFCSDCSDCARQSKVTKARTTNPGNSRASRKLCSTQWEPSRTDPTNEILKAIDQARSSKHLKVPQRYEYYEMTRPTPSDQISVKNEERLKYQLKKQDIDHKYSHLMRQKSMKLHLDNQKKKVVGLNKHQEDLKQQQRRLQKGAFVALRQQKAKYVKSVQSKIINLQKERLLDAKRGFKEELQENQRVNNRNIQWMETANNNQMLELRQKLQELKQIKRVNKVDQKKVLHHLESELRREQEQSNSRFVSEVQNHLQRAQLIPRK